MSRLYAGRVRSHSIGGGWRQSLEILYRRLDKMDNSFDDIDVNININKN